jgi:hypothetical protein
MLSTPAMGTLCTIPRQQENMTNFKTYIKKGTRTNRVLLGLLFLGFTMLLVYPIILSNFTKTISFIFLTIGMLSTISLVTIIVFFRNSDFINGIVTNGMISFDERQIHCNDQSFNFSDLTDIHIFYAGYPKSREQIHVYTTGNYIKFNLNETSLKIFFLIENELDRQKLVTLLKKFDETGIKFKETTSQGLSYFLNINLNYADIQALKTKRQE